jgi:hypothetical protein
MRPETSGGCRRDLACPRRAAPSHGRNNLLVRGVDPTGIEPVTSACKAAPHSRLTCRFLLKPGLELQECSWLRLDGCHRFRSSCGLLAD